MPITYEPLLLFPLPLILLPGGRQRLTVIDPESLMLITEIFKQDKKFITVFGKSELLKSQADSKEVWGAVTSITDFGVDEKGWLTVDILSEQFVSVHSISQQIPGQWKGVAYSQPHWSMIKEDLDSSLLSEALESLFAKRLDISSLYPNARYEQAGWVCARLLELLPMPYRVKKSFLEPDSFESFVQFLNIIFESEQIK